MCRLCGFGNIFRIGKICRLFRLSWPINRFNWAIAGKGVTDFGWN
jgi:hypothetical protein